MEKMIEREVARRVFAFEFNRSNVHHSEGDDHAPNYIITPTGAKCNRLFIIGVVTEVENIGTNNDLWKVRVADPTGVFTVYAGQYQPEAAIFFSEINVPEFVAIVGKARTYEPEEGNVYTSIRPEEVNIANEKLRDRWIVDTAERTFERIKNMRKALNTDLRGDKLREYLISGGMDHDTAEGISLALDNYYDIESRLDELMRVIETAAIAVTGGMEIPKPDFAAPAKDYRPPEVPVVPEMLKDKDFKENKDDSEEKDPKEVVLALMEMMDKGRGIMYSDLLDEAVKGGMNAEIAENAVKELMEEGRCYEPKIGVLKKI